MTKYDIPGAAIGLVKDGRVIMTKGYGVRSAATNAPVTENTQFPISSITKSFTALAVMRLVEEGKLNLDTPVIKYLAEFKLSDPQATQKVTLRHLLTHTSGLPRLDEGLFEIKDRNRVLADIGQIKLTARPGELWQYSNQGYVVIGAVIERVSGQSWEDYLAQQVLTPLGLKEASFNLNGLQKAAEYATPHVIGLLGKFLSFVFADPQGVAPCCGLNASVTEMAHYLNFWLGDGSTPEGQRLLKASSLAQLISPQFKLPDDGVFTNRGYGFGWATGEYRGNKIVTHDGLINGFYADVVMAPSSRAGVVILTNLQATKPTETFATAASLYLLEGLLGLKPDLELPVRLNQAAGGDLARHQADLDTARTYSVDPASFGSLLGEYTGRQGKLKVTSRDGKLFLQSQTAGAEQTYELTPFKPDGFIASNVPLNYQTFEFKPDKSGLLTIYREGLVLAAQVADYRDSQGRFSLVIPAGSGLEIQTQAEMGVIYTANPPALVRLGAIQTDSEELTASLLRLVKKLDPAFDALIESSQNLALPNGSNWSQYVYQLPGDQQLLVSLMQRKGVTYFVTLQAKTADLSALTSTYNILLEGFRTGPL